MQCNGCVINYSVLPFSTNSEKPFDFKNARKEICNDASPVRAPLLMSEKLNHPTLFLTFSL